MALNKKDLAQIAELLKANNEILRAERKVENDALKKELKAHTDDWLKKLKETFKIN